MNPDNACTLRITAAAGTELAGAYSSGTVKHFRKSAFLPRKKKFTIQRTFILHAAWLGQTCVHCPIFLTAASRRSRARVSVPVWLIMLSHQLLIVDLVGRYPANYLINRTPIRYRNSLAIKRCLSMAICGINPSFPGLSHSNGKVAYVLRTRLPVAAHVLLHCDAPRLACIKPAASVHPEPGSNSPL